MSDGLPSWQAGSRLDLLPHGQWGYPLVVLAGMVTATVKTVAAPCRTLRDGRVEA